MPRLHPLLLSVSAVGLAAASLGAFTQSIIVTSRPDPPPAELADPIEALMAPGDQRVSVAGATLDFWWVKSMPLVPSSTDVSWSAVEEGTLVGAVTLSSRYRDIRGATLKPGHYTLRYGIEPQNGDHAGVSPYRDFLLLSPADTDNSVAALGHDSVIGISRQSIGGSHPACWALDPPVAAGERIGSVKMNDTEQSAVIFSVPTSRDGKDVGALKFGLVLVGTVY
ncbi:MAG TPA: hypothetical protein VGJ29_15825 [Vicinamibacterales bacterium]